MLQKKPNAANQTSCNLETALQQHRVELISTGDFNHQHKGNASSHNPKELPRKAVTASHKTTTTAQLLCTEAALLFGITPAAATWEANAGTADSQRILQQAS